MFVRDQSRGSCAHRPSCWLAFWRGPLPKDLAVFSSMFPFGYSENAVCYQFSILSAKKHIAALALLRCSIILQASITPPLLLL